MDRTHELFKDVVGYGWLHNCFVLERKHRVGKRFAEPHSNACRMQSGGLLSEVLCQTIHDISEAPELNGLAGGKLQARQCELESWVHLTLSATHILVANRSYHSNVSYSDASDFVVLIDSHDSSMRAGFVQLH